MPHYECWWCLYVQRPCCPLPVFSLFILFCCVRNASGGEQRDENRLCVLMCMCSSVPPVLFSLLCFVQSAAIGVSAWPRAGLSHTQLAEDMNEACSSAACIHSNSGNLAPSRRVVRSCGHVCLCFRTYPPWNNQKITFYYSDALLCSHLRRSLSSFTLLAGSLSRGQLWILCVYKQQSTNVIYYTFIVSQTFIRPAW